MSKLQLFRGFINERLAAVGLEIFEQFDKALAECEEELTRSREQNEKLQRMLHIFMNQPRIKLHQTVVPQTSLPGSPQIKEEQDLWTIQEGGHLVRLQSTQTNATEEPIKAESDVEDYGEPASHSPPLAPDSRTGPVISSFSGADSAAESDEGSSEEPESNAAETPFKPEERDEACSRPDVVLSALQNINEDDSEGEECAQMDRGVDREVNINRSPESDSGSESEAEDPPERDWTVWSDIPITNSQEETQEANTMQETPGPTSYAKDNITSALSSLLCLIDTEMLDNILKYTEAEARRNNAAFNLTMDELIAFLGLIYLRGATGGKSMSLEDYWSAEWGNPFFKDTLPRQKFRDIMRYLRFDDKTTRNARLVDDKFAMISEVFGQFVKNCSDAYTPGENITVDEQLCPTQAKCRFSQYMADKPEKFGIKFWVAADVATNYVLNLHPYLGEDGNRPAGQRLSDDVVMRLMEPFLEKGRNVTTNNFITSMPLAKNLFGRKTTIVGAMSTIRHDLPPCAHARFERFSSRVLSAGDATLTIYQARPKKNLCILSTMHQAVSVEEGTKKLPNTVAHYNATKYGVEIMDQMARMYSVKGGTRRWPVAVFYNILDLAAINAHILYKECMGVSISRKKFILKLVKEMCQPQRMTRAARAANEKLARKRLLLEPPMPYAKRRRCQIRQCAGNKTCDACLFCKRAVCGKCSLKAPPICMECKHKKK